MCYEVGLDWIVQYLILLPLCLQATGVREDQILVTILPGLPTAAEFFLLPDKRLTEGKAEKSSAHLDQVSQQPAPSAPVSSSRHCMSGRIYFPSLSSLKFHHAKVWIKSLLFPAFVSHGLIPFCSSSSLSSNCSLKQKFLLPPADVSIVPLKPFQVFRRV